MLESSTDASNETFNVFKSLLLTPIIASSKDKANSASLALWTSTNVVIFKLLRGAFDAPHKGKVSIVGRNPEAIWFSGYEDRVIFDEAGLFTESMQSTSSVS